MALVFHCKRNPHRLPVKGTLSRGALRHINIFRAEELKQGAIILRMRRQLDAL